jgi:putative acetyltransferase
MTARANPPAGLRPYLPADAPLLAEIFRASVTELTGEDYTAAQQEAWAAAADDEGAFAARLGKELTLVATIGGAPVGFAALNAATIDMLYVHPAVAGRGVGAMLCEALEKLAAGRGVAKLTADASDNALGFFTHRGYEAQRRNTVPRGGEWFANTTVTKQLAAAKDNP